jgi:tetratricopeptide (TPR) repeat protein
MRSARRPNQTASFAAVSGIAAALALSVVAAQADEDDCSAFDQVERAEACTALIELGARSPKEMSYIHVLRGEFYRKRGLLDLAFVDFAEALDLFPGSIDAYFHRALAYRDKNQLNEALADLDQAASSAEWLGPRVERAAVLELLHENERALEDYDYVVLRAPEFAPSYLSRGEFLLRSGNLDRAKSDFDRAVALKQLKQYAPVAFYDRALVLHRMGDLDGAISDYTRAIELSPDRLDYRAARDLAYPALGERGFAHSLKGQQTAALADLDKAIELSGGNARLYDVRCAVLLEMDQLDRAKADSDRALALDPTSLDARARAADILAAQGRPERALAEFDRLIAIDPKRATLHIGKGLVLLSQARIDRALAEFDRALANPSPLTANALVGRGAALLAKGRVKEANAVFDRAAGMDPDSAKATTARALGLLAAKQAGQAIAALDQSITNGSEEPSMFLLRGKALLESGELDRALADFDLALRLRPMYADALTARGMIWLKKNDFQRAVADLGQSIAAHPSIGAYVARGEAYEMQGKCSLASADYRKAREMKVDAFFAAEAQLVARSRLEQLARHKSCGPVDKRRFASGGLVAF